MPVAKQPRNSGRFALLTTAAESSRARGSADVIGADARRCSALDCEGSLRAPRGSLRAPGPRRSPSAKRRCLMRN
eukprot:CAMPEP_0179955060 /NCGR_PEP_ID=MMETSP0983-20121128/25911_1 /TAXON_ID=483367 /ORGANISM="non described non described, Strain CCMP 2436" /LENGTH=74 /DNA_ID=CAMNT_0021866329 /DNA_START=475 /DNA_END=696 /DNA_ORIENTATION=-